MGSSKGDLLNPYIREVVKNLTEIVLTVYLPETGEKRKPEDENPETDDNLSS